MKKKQLLVCALFLFSACNDKDSGDPATEPQEALPNIVINEFMASNTACCADPDGEDEYNDWLELYNAGGEAVNIGGWYVSDDINNPKKFQIPATDASKTTIAPGGYLVLWADNQPEQGVLHLDFALSANGEDIGIYAPDGRAVDEHSFSAETTDVSSGRLPNGKGNWATLSSPSPGAANQ